MQTDLHSHLIPGIDDGARTMEESLELLRGLYALGFRRVITTPHVMADSFRNSTERILRGLRELREAAEDDGIPIQIAAAAEYYLDEELTDRVRRNDLLCVGENGLLFETSYFSEPIHLTETVYELAASGYRPLMAHPERCRYVRDPEKFYGELRRLGVLFQVNITSLGGMYGEDAYQKARWLMERGWIDFVGSDLHRRKQLEFLEEMVRQGLPGMLSESNRLQNDSLKIL